MILPHEDDGYWDLIKTGMTEAEAKYGEEYHPDVKYLIPQLNYSIAQMTELVEQETAARTDMLVVQGNENPEYF